ncbi:hypothetical protein [Coleofasciculus sp. E2-BRE-01]|uniref:hypothetical protein n=1 Tax=Coleofasciculus sp. E2-BRE-01 TaxID=3069524 RepID=UPI0033032539
MRVLKHVVVVSAILLFSISPILSVLIASLIADRFGCRLHEGFANPCIINGKDYGETLTSMFIAGWYIFLSIPIGMVLLILYPVSIVLIKAMKRKGR